MITYFGTDDDLQGIGLCTGDDNFMGGRVSRQARRERRGAGRAQRREKFRKFALATFVPGGKLILAAQALKKRMSERRAVEEVEDTVPQIEQTAQPMIPEPVSVVPEAVEQSQETSEESEGAVPEEGASEGEAEQVEGLSGDMTIPIIIGAAIGLYILTRKK